MLSANIGTPDMFAHLKKQKPNIKALKNAVERLMLATTQKSAGQRPENNPDNSVNFSSPEIDMIQFIILAEAVALVLSGKLDKLDADNEQEGKE
jgi:hypothetical protein